MGEERLSIKQTKEALLKEDKFTLKDNIDDAEVIHQCYKALSVVEAIQAILSKENTCPEEDCDAIWDIMNEAYPYWYADV